MNLTTKVLLITTILVISLLSIACEELGAYEPDNSCGFGDNKSNADCIAECHNYADAIHCDIKSVEYIKQSENNQND